MRTLQDLQQLQGLPLNLKIRMTKSRIRQWINEFGEDGVYVSFSGGKDSTVLLHLVREDYPNVKAVFMDTGLEYPEIRQFVKTFDNVEWLKPKMNFKQVIQKYGYPFISKEVAECVYGARKYLTRVMEQASLDRQTDRQTDRQSQNIGIDLISYADSMSLQQPSRGGRTASTARPEESENSVNFPVPPLKMGVGGERRNTASNSRSSWRQEDIRRAVYNCKIGVGGPARDFANLTGIRTAEGSIAPKLWSHYRQFSDSASDGNSSSDGEGNDGDYP